MEKNAPKQVHHAFLVLAYKRNMLFRLATQNEFMKSQKKLQKEREKNDYA